METQSETAIVSAAVSLEKLREELVTVSPIVRQAQKMTIETKEDYEMAGMLMGMIAKRRKANWDRVTVVVDQNHKAWKEACDLRNDAVRNEDEAAEILNRKLQAFDEEQERVRREREAAESTRLKKEQEAAAIAEAESLQAIGETELAEQVILQAVEAPSPVVVLSKDTPKMKEMQARETWQFEVMDEKLVPREFMSPDPKKIGAVVRSQKKLTSIAGVRIWSEKNFHGRTT
jgi:hypothetical protein